MTPPNQTEPWLIAAWPGMGSVALVAAGYLARALDLKEAGDFRTPEYFNLNDITVKRGLVLPARFPRGVFFRRAAPGPGPDPIVFLAEAQPATGAFPYAQRLIAEAAGFGVKRVMTFASIASGLHPSENPKVSGAVTDAKTLEELRKAEVDPIEDGEIGGLNGLLLAAAAEKGLSGFCLLAEIPYFAAAVPNPKAARAALSVFSVLSGIDLELEELNQQAATVDRALIEALEKLQRERDGEDQGSGEPGAKEPEASPAPEASATPEPRESSPPAADAPLDAATRARIEQLFADALQDPQRAVTLKQELDRLGVFKRYEDRFLDLFRRRAG